MADYYYTKGGERQGPIPEAELASLIQGGSVSSTDYFWTQGMSDWQLVSTATFASPVVADPQTVAPTPSVNPFDAPAVASQTPAEVTPTVADAATAPATSAPTETPSVFGTGTAVPQHQMDTVFVKDVANALPKPLWLILPAVVMFLVGIPYLIFLVGAIYIWMGVLLFQANGGLERARRTGSSRDLMSALSKIKTLFIITGVMTLIGIVFLILALIFLIAVGDTANF